MSIEQTKVVDLISVEDLTDKVLLTISDHLSWDGDIHEHLCLLQEKINSYLRYIESNEILEAYPKAADKEKIIRVVFKYQPIQHGIGFLASIKSKLEEETDIGFRYEVFTE